MPIPSTIADLSTVAASNSPQGSESPTEGDNYIRALSSIIRQEHDNLANSSTGAGMSGYDPDTAYGANTVGSRLNEELTTSGFASLQAAVTAAAGKRLRVIGTHTLVAAVILPSNIEIVGDPSAKVTTATADISLFQATGNSNIRIRCLKFEQTVAGAVAYTGAVKLSTCTRCVVEQCEFVGMQWAGVFLDSSNECQVIGNKFSAFLGTVQDSADVCVYGNSSFNVVRDNICNGGNWHGILHQDPYAGTSPLKNIITGNRVGQHKAYGIAVYQPNTVNTYTQVIGNLVENVLGSVLAGSAGAGIYVVGAGGVVVSNNTIRNCCQQTSNRTLVPGAIGINGINLPLAPIVVSGNNIADTNYYDGITFSSSSAGGLLDGNDIVSNNGNTTGAPIYVNGVSNLSIVNNRITQKDFTGQPCILLYAQGVDCNNNVVSNNNVVGGNYSQIEFQVAGAFKHNGINVLGNNLSGGSSSCVPLRFNKCVIGLVVGNFVTADTQVALLNSDSTTMRYSTNFFFTTGSNPVQFTGANTSGVFDRTNQQLSGGGSQRMALNQGTGMAIEAFDSAAPATGTWAVGDRVEQNVPVVGQPKGWRCTVAGTPGTWVSEGNL